MLKEIAKLKKETHISVCIHTRDLIDFTETLVKLHPLSEETIFTILFVERKHYGGDYTLLAQLKGGSQQVSVFGPNYGYGTRESAERALEAVKADVIGETII